MEMKEKEMKKEKKGRRMTGRETAVASTVMTLLDWEDTKRNASTWNLDLIPKTEILFL